MKAHDLSEKLKRFNRQIITKEFVPAKNNLNTILKILVESTSGEIHSNEFGDYLLVKNELPPGSYFGNRQLKAGLDDKINHSFYSKDEISGFSFTKDLLFFDIESTGLSGSGAVPFLIGFGSVINDRFEVRQYFLPDFPDERAMLTAVAREITPDKTLVTFNGATFDVQFLKERYIINRIDYELEYFHHIDLLHSCRRLFKLRLKDCSLGSIERNLFGYERVGDIPGYLVPSVYFDWITSQATDNLNDVLKHNKQDIISLMILIYEIKEIFESEGLSISEKHDVFSLSKIYKNRKQDEKVIRLINSQPDINQSAEMLYLQSLSFKRQRDWGKASIIWNRLAEEKSEIGYKASIELAKYYEHNIRALDKALDCVKTAKSIKIDNINEQKILIRREKRLCRKLSLLKPG